MSPAVGGTVGVDFTDSARAQALNDGILAGRVGVWRWEVDSGQLFWSPNLEQIHGLPAGHFDGTFSFFERDIHPDDRASVREAIEAALVRGGDYTVSYRLPPREGAPDRWLEARGRVILEGGRPALMTGICQDVSDLKTAQVELAARVGQQESIVRLGQEALNDIREDDLLAAAVREVVDVLGVDLCKVLELMPGGEEMLLRAGHGWSEGLIGNVRVSAGLKSQAGFTLRTGKAVVVENLAEETRFEHPELLVSHDAVSGMSAVIAGDDGRPYGVIGVHARSPRTFTHSDADYLQSVANIICAGITRARARERQHILIRELRHRSGNLLALTLSLFNNSASGAGSIEELSQKFQARVVSLSRAHSIVAESGFRSASFDRLVEEVLAPYRERLNVAGPALMLEADTGFALCLALHELATNAAKYGALSSSAGALTIEWRRAELDGQPVLALDWTEEGGPMVTPPARQGFGSRLVKMVIENQLGGEVDMDFAEDGLRVRLAVPLTG